MNINPEIAEEALFNEAYLTYLIDCSKCQNILVFKDAADPIEVWATEASKVVIKLGWGADNSSEVQCPDCNAR